MITSLNPRIVKNPYGESVFLIKNIEDKAFAAFKEVLKEHAIVNSQEHTQRMSNELCSMPTAVGLQNGHNDVRCGVWSFKSLGGDPTLEKSGVKWLAQDYIMGRKVLFAEGGSVETGTSRQTSESVSKTREHSQERSTSQGATVVKPSR